MDQHACSPQIISIMEDLLADLYQLAQQQQLETIEHWLHQEQHGYGDFTHYPDYRVLECQQYGIFIKADHELQHFEQIHDECLSERDRCRLHFLHLHGSLLNSLQRNNEVKQDWPTAILANYSQEIIPGYTCIKAWQSSSVPLTFRLLTGFFGHLWHLSQHTNPKVELKISHCVNEHCQEQAMLASLWKQLSDPKQQRSANGA